MQNAAAVILEQLQTINRAVLWSWGAHAYKAVQSGQLTDSFGNHCGTLVFKVNGRLRKGHVAIALMPNDTYTVHYGSLRKGTFKVAKTQSDVYVDNMMDVIDREVETPE